MYAVGLSSRPERYAQLRAVTLFGPDNRPLPGQPCEVESVWEHRGMLVFKFGGIDTRNEAELLRGAEVRIPISERPPLPDGEYYYSDLVGCEVVEAGTEERLGSVTGWTEAGGAGLLHVEVPGRADELLIPLSRSICIEIDTAAKRIVVDLPEGLKELNFA